MNVSRRWFILISIILLLCVVTVPTLTLGLRAAGDLFALAPGDDLAIHCETALVGQINGQQTELTCAPAAEPTVAPAAEPTVAPEVVPTEAPAVEPTVAPEVVPTEAPAVEPTIAPEFVPTEASALPDQRNIADDGSDWQNWSWGGDFDLRSSATAAKGSTSISATFHEAWAGFYLHNEQPISTAGYSAVQFQINGSEAGGQRLRLCASASCDAGSQELSAPANSWQTFSVPLSALGNPANLSDLVWQDITGSAQQTFYLDAVELVR